MLIGVDFGAAEGDVCICCLVARDAAGMLVVGGVRRIRRREVSARRARALRRRGLRCHRIGSTSTGKARYVYFSSDYQSVQARSWLDRLSRKD